jgi:hypothetical protein
MCQLFPNLSRRTFTALLGVPIAEVASVSAVRPASGSDCVIVVLIMRCPLRSELLLAARARFTAHHPSRGQI